MNPSLLVLKPALTPYPVSTAVKPRVEVGLKQIRGERVAARP